MPITLTCGENDSQYDLFHHTTDTEGSEDTLKPVYKNVVTNCRVNSKTIYHNNQL